MFYGFFYGIDIFYVLCYYVRPVMLCVGLSGCCMFYRDWASICKFICPSVSMFVVAKPTYVFVCLSVLIFFFSAVQRQL